MKETQKNAYITRDTATRIALSREIRANMPDLTDGERAAALAIMEAGAASMQMSLSDYVQNTFPNGVFGDFSTAQNAAHQRGVEINGAVSVRGFGDSVRATIYASKTADFSTFVHELSHVWQAQLRGKLKNDAEKAFHVQNGDWKGSTYTFADGHTDTSAEAFAYGFEDFLKKKAGEMASEDKKAVFEKFADYMARTYNGTKEHVRISEDIAKVYEQFVQLDDNILAEAEKAVRMEREEEFRQRELNIKHTKERLDYIQRYYTNIKDRYHEVDAVSSDGKHKGKIEIADDRNIADKRTQKEIDALLTFTDMGFYATMLSESQKLGYEKHIDALLNHRTLVEIKSPTGNANTIAKEIQEAINKENAELVSVFLLDNAKNVTNEDILAKLEMKKPYIHGKSDGVFIARDGMLSEIKIPREVALRPHSPSNSYDNTNPENVNNKIQFQSAYHGSGASFDRFNTAEYGFSGEGSMVFGWGTYLTDSEKIARDYADRQTEKKQNDIYQMYRQAYYNAALNGEKERAEELFKKMLESEKTEGHRNLYTVTIPDGNYLQWDKKAGIRAVRKVATELEKRGYKYPTKLPDYLENATLADKIQYGIHNESGVIGQNSGTFADLYEITGNILNPSADRNTENKEASAFFHSIGYTGISYPAGTIHGGGGDATNYVIFNDDDITIDEHLQFQTRESAFASEQPEFSELLSASQWEKIFENEFRKENEYPEIKIRRILEKSLGDEEKEKAVRNLSDKNGVNFDVVKGKLEEEKRNVQLETHHVLKEEETRNLPVVTQEEFNRIVDALYQEPKPDYKNIPNIIRLPQINEELAKELGIENANFFLKANVAHVRPERKGGYNQDLRIEEMKGMLDFIRNANTAYIDNDARHKNFMLAGLDSQNAKKSNKIVFDKDEFGNYIVTIGKVDTFNLEEAKYDKVAVGLEPTIWMEHAAPSFATMLRPSTTLQVGNEPDKTTIAQNEEKSINTQGEKTMAQNQEKTAGLTREELIRQIAKDMDENYPKPSDENTFGTRYVEKMRAKVWEDQLYKLYAFDHGGNPEDTTVEQGFDLLPVGSKEREEYSEKLRAELQEFREKEEYQEWLESLEDNQQAENRMERLQGIPPEERPVIEIDDGIEQMQANGGMSESAMEAEIAAQENLRPDYLDEQGNPHWFDEEEESDEPIDMAGYEFAEYIHSPEFIEKFGDWEKANRLEKLKKAESIIGNESIIIEGVDVSDLVTRLRSNYSKENLKQLQEIARDAGRDVLEKLRQEQNISFPNPPKIKNLDSGTDFKFQMTGINEIKNHDIFKKGHIEAISSIPEIIKNGIFISTESNEDGRKPQYVKFHYFASGYKLDNEDYTAKIVFAETKDGELFYDQSLSTIEKGRLIDILQEKNKLEAVNRINRSDSIEPNEALNPLISQENLDIYDKRLVRICQVPQMPYLEKNLATGEWQPTDEAVELVKSGQLRVEKNGQEYEMINDKEREMQKNQTKTVNASEVYRDFDDKIGIASKELSHGMINYLHQRSAKEEATNEVAEMDLLFSNFFSQNIQSPALKAAANELLEKYSDSRIVFDVDNIDLGHLELIDRDGFKDIQSEIEELKAVHPTLVENLRNQNPIEQRENAERLARAAEVDWSDPMEAAEAAHDETIDDGIEQMQANGGMSEAAMEAEIAAQENSRPDYLDEQGNPHWFDEEEETEILSDEEIERLKMQEFREKERSENAPSNTQREKTEKRNVAPETEQAVAEQMRSVVKDALYQNAEPLRTIDFTSENYDRLFPRGVLQTPIETVKLGDNQFAKMEAKDRERFLLASYETLANPDLIILENRADGKSHNYVKSFVFDEKTKAVQDVVVSIDGENISITSHPRGINNLVNKIKTPDQLIFMSAEIRHLVEQRTQNEQSIVNPTMATVRTVPSNTDYNRESVLSTIEAVTKSENKENQQHSPNLSPKEALLKRLGEMANEQQEIERMEEQNKKSEFDEELLKFNNGEIPESYVFNLGKPSEILKNCGFPPNDRIELAASRLRLKASQGNHPFEIMDIAGLDKALQNPVAVFEYGNGSKSQNVIVNLEKDGKNFLVGVFFNQNRDGFEVSSIRGLFNRDNLDWMRWIQQGKMIYGDKEKIQVLAAQQRTNLADVNSKEARTSSDSYYLDSVDSILQKFGDVKDVYTKDFPEYAEQKEKFEIFKQFRNAYQETDSINAYDAVRDADEFYNAIKNNDKSVLEKFTNGIDKPEIAGAASLFLNEQTQVNGGEVQIESTLEKAADLLKNMKFNSENYKDLLDVINKISSMNGLEKLEVPKEEKIKQSINATDVTELVSDKSEYTSVNEKSESTLEQSAVKKDDFIGTELPSFASMTQNGLEVFKSCVVSDYDEASERYIVKSKEATLYLKKSAIEKIAESKNQQNELDKDSPEYDSILKNVLKTQYEDFFNPRENTATNFGHNFRVYCRNEANSPLDSIEIAKKMIEKMDREEQKKVRKFLKQIDKDDLGVNAMLIEMYNQAVKEIPLNEEMVKNKFPDLLRFRPHYDIVQDNGAFVERNPDLIKKIGGKEIDFNLRVGQVVENINIKVPSAIKDGFHQNEYIKMDLKVISASKETNSIILMDGKHSFLELPRDTFLKSYEKHIQKEIVKEQKQVKKEQKSSLSLEIA